MKHPIVIGIDPGASGGMAIFAYGELAAAQATMATLYDRTQKIGQLFLYCGNVHGVDGVRKNVIAVIEKPLLARRDGKTNAAGLIKNAKSQGEWCGLCAAQGWEVVEVDPRQWQVVLKGLPGADSKQRVKNYIKRIHPEWLSYCTGPRGGWLDGVADAICIAEWGASQYPWEEVTC